jgi:hypothetical protein
MAAWQGSPAMGWSAGCSCSLTAAPRSEAARPWAMPASPQARCSHGFRAPGIRPGGFRQQQVASGQGRHQPWLVLKEEGEGQVPNPTSEAACAIHGTGSLPLSPYGRTGPSLSSTRGHGEDRATTKPHRPRPGINRRMSGRSGQV